jgi:omega-6 fatty acid desaturase (delta-12 desaturase)
MENEPDARSERELIRATKPLTVENRAKSWWALVQTLIVLAALLAGTVILPHLALRLAASLVAGLTVVRLFILYHDFMHGALLRRSKVARAIFYVYGTIVMTPPRVWRETHNYHHAHTAKIVGSHIGSYLTVTTGMWMRMKPLERFAYRAIRHPLTILLGYFTIFMWGMCVAPFVRAPKKHVDALIALVTNWALTALILWKFGFAVFALTYFLPLAVAMASGAYLFYAQHNFPDVHIQGRDSWSYARAALESSSYMKMGPVMEWFTGNIGYHHVHHLNQLIPFYRLPEAMEQIPELQSPRVTSLAPKDILACFAQKLWDPQTKRMVGYPS